MDNPGHHGFRYPVDHFVAKWFGHRMKVHRQNDHIAVRLHPWYFHRWADPAVHARAEYMMQRWPEVQLFTDMTLRINTGGRPSKELIRAVERYVFHGVGDPADIIEVSRHQSGEQTLGAPTRAAERRNPAASQAAGWGGPGPTLDTRPIEDADRMAADVALDLLYTAPQNVDPMSIVSLLANSIPYFALALGRELGARAYVALLAATPGAADQSVAADVLATAAMRQQGGELATPDAVIRRMQGIVSLFEDVGRINPVGAKNVLELFCTSVSVPFEGYGGRSNTTGLAHANTSVEVVFEQATSARASFGLG